MSTRAVIARVTGTEGQFKGVYQHWDGYPNGLGKKLYMLYSKFNHDLNGMLRYLIDEHLAGWSVAGEECYCHPKRHRDAETEPNWFTHENTESDIEWIYAFDVEANRMYVRDNRHDAEEIVDLTGPEPDWNVLECGANWERCSHYACFHFPELSGSNLGMQTYLGRREFEMHDAVAFIINGKRYASTGSGGNSDYLAGHTHNPYPRNCWVASLTRCGHRKDVVVAKIQDGKYTPYPGVAWVFPGRKNRPEETIVGGA
jgi:hypothetical protein